jgi:hypothetical protein
MATLERLDLRDDLFTKLEIAARRNRTTVAQLAGEMLARALEEDEQIERALMDEVRQGREELKHIFLTDDDLAAAKKWGRK